LDGRLRVGIGYGKARGVEYIGDFVCSWELMTDRDFITWWYDRWHHPVA